MNKLLFLGLASSLFLSSCATKFTEAQKTQLQTLSVSQPSVNGDAYKEPSGDADVDFSQTGAVGMQGGALGALIGQLVVEGVQAGQRASFNKAYASSIAKAKSSTPSNLSSTLREKTTYSINAIPQLKGKITPNSANQLSTQITSYGYARTGKTDGKILMTPYVSANVSLNLNGQQAMPSQSYTGYAYSPQEGQTSPHDLNAYVANKTLAKNDFAKACEHLANQIASNISAKF